MLNRILVTGAAGGLGKSLRPHLSKLAKHVRLSDIADLGTAGEGEELVQADLSDMQAVADLVRDCDGIVHLGGMSVESPGSQFCRPISWGLITFMKRPENRVSRG